MEFMVELFEYMKERKKYWLIPLITVLLIFGIFMVYISGSAIAPLIYPLF